MANPLCCAAKCCGCIVCSQLITLLFALLPLILFLVAFELYVKPWGENEICAAFNQKHGCDISKLNLDDASLQCSGCVLGVNSQWPTNTTGALHFLDTSAGTTISSVVGVSLAGAAVTGAGSMLLASIFPSMASALSFASGFYEMTHIFEQAQYIGMIGQLQIEGAPEFLNQFSKQLAWTNFNVPKSISSKIVPFLPSRSRRLTSTSVTSGESGPTKYAGMLGVEPTQLFWYTVAIFAAVIVLIHMFYVVWLLIVSAFFNKKKLSFGKLAAKWYRKVIWAVILVLLLAQYIIAMSGSYFIYQNTSGTSSTVYAGIALALLIGGALVLGLTVVANNTDELRDVGSYAHDKRAFAAKYGAYYDEYNFDNRFFFIPRILLAVGTGAIVGIVQNASLQLFLILGMTVLYLVLVIFREPNLLRFLFYVALVSVFMKVVLLCLMLVLVQDDYFPQSVRDKVSYAIIGINVFVFFLLFLRQAYVITYKLIRGCKNKGKNLSDDEDDDDDDDSHVELGMERGDKRGAGEQYGRMETPPDRQHLGVAANDPYGQRQQQQQQQQPWQQQQQQQAQERGAPYNGYGQPNQSYDQEPSAAAAAYMGQQAYGKDPQQRSSDSYDETTQAAVPKEAEKFTWRRNMERRAADDEANQRALQEPSFMTFGSSSSGNDASQYSNAYSGNQQPHNNSNDWDMQPTEQYGNSVYAANQTTSAMFNERSPTDLDASYSTGMTRDVRDEPMAMEYADSYSSFVSDFTNGSVLTSHSNPLGEDMQSSEALGSERFDVQSFGDEDARESAKLEHLAVEYLSQMGDDGAANADNDLGDDDDDEAVDGNENVEENEEGVFEDARGNDTTLSVPHSVDIDAEGGSDSDQDESAAMGEQDVDVDDDVDDDVDIDVDIDSMPLRENDSLLSIESDGQIDAIMVDSGTIKKVDDIGIDDQDSDSEARRPALNLAKSGMPRLLSQKAPASDDSVSFYLNASDQNSSTSSQSPRRRDQDQDQYVRLKM